MKKESRKDIVLIFYVLTVIALAFLYFSVPESKEFYEFQLKWWGEVREVAASFF